LTKSITKPIDIEACNTLSAQLGIPSDSAAWISLQMEEAAYDYSGMADSTIFLTDYKDYDIGSHKVGFGCMACVEGEIDGFIDRMLTVAPEVMKLRDRDMLFTTIEERVPNPVPDAARLKPYVFGSLYFLYFGEGTKAAAETVLGSSLRDGVILIHEQLSRKQIVPKLTEVLK
jgi:manganese-dependent inorganic pyrophosphatase